MMSADSVLPAIGGMGTLLSVTLLVSASTTGRVVGAGLATALAPADAAGLALAAADAAGLALAEAAGLALAAALAGAAAEAGLGAALEAAGGLDGAALPPHAARNARDAMPKYKRQDLIRRPPSGPV